MKKATKILVLTAVFILFAQSAFAGGGAMIGGATEATQWLNKVQLEAIHSAGLDEVYNGIQIFNKTVQMYTNMVQQLAEAVKSNLGMPFAVVNDFKNAFTRLYGTVKGAGEGLFSYTNANNWMSDITNRTGAMASLEYMQKSNKAGYQLTEDIITKGESEIALAKDVENASNSADGVTKAVQANTRANLLVDSAVHDLTISNVSFAQMQYNRWAVEDNIRAKDLEKAKETCDYAVNYKW